MVEVAAIVPGANRQALHHFRHDAPWDAEALNRRRLHRWRAHPYLGPQAQGVLSVEETGDPTRGSRIVLAAHQYLGKLGHVRRRRDQPLGRRQAPRAAGGKP